MKQTKNWIKRKLLSFEFKGRQRRALLWRKGIYEEWFYCARYAQMLGRKLPSAFGNLTGFQTFEEWWRHPEFGFELFCEPFIDSYAEIVDRKVRLSKDEVLLKVNVNGDTDLILRDIKLALMERMVIGEYQSRARFQPSRTMKYLRKNTLVLSRRVWELTNEGFTQGDIAEKLDLINGDTIEARETAIRKVQRAKARFIKSLKNVENGTFP